MNRQYVDVHKKRNLSLCIAISVEANGRCRAYICYYSLEDVFQSWKNMWNQQKNVCFRASWSFEFEGQVSIELQLFGLVSATAVIDIVRKEGSLG